MKKWISLNMTPGIGPRKATELFEKFGSVDRIFGALRSELESVRLRPESIQSILAKQFHDRADREYEAVRKLGGEIIILDDGVYPQMLREIPDPPLVLYVFGNWLECFETPSVGVVGSRRCTTYGKNTAEMLSRDLASVGVTVTSGFARGIDSAAHKGALEAGGKTIAVFGTGLDRVYPRENARLMNEILESGGSVVTQFPLGTPPLRDNFPYRNRIISGLSHALLVIEASEKSGSLITARLAAEQDREVLAVPGNITSKNSFGTNYLIKSGAKLVQHWQDVVSEFPSEVGAKILPPKTENTVGSRPIEASFNLSPAEKKILKLIDPDANMHIDDILDATGLGFGDANQALVSLDLKNLIHVLPGNHYAKKL
ncbi:MAG: DNA-processing protein DprA [Pyrinomonadaceae bacterium]